LISEKINKFRWNFGCRELHVILSTRMDIFLSLLAMYRRNLEIISDYFSAVRISSSSSCT